MTPNSKRSWIIGLALVALVLVLGAGFLWMQNNADEQRACDLWREDFRDVADDAEEAMAEGTFLPDSGKSEDSPLGQRLAKLITEQPDECPEPDSAFNELFEEASHARLP